MGTVAANTITRPIGFIADLGAANGRGGQTSALAEVYTCLAEVAILKAGRRLEAAQESLEKGYEFTIWVDPDFEPSVSHQISYDQERYAIRAKRYQDNTQRKWVLTGLVVGTL